MKTSSLLFIAGLAPWTLALQATTTHYYDGQKGACGCGPVSGSSLFSWQLGIAPGVYTAAGSQALFDLSGASWCGASCGLCYQLTSTGAAPCSGCGLGGDAGQSIIVMVTNLCPNNGNAQWCPVVGGTNQYGYSYHFDIMAQSEVFGDNPVVNFEPIACPAAALSDYSQCQCPIASGSPLPPASSSSSSSILPPSSTYTPPPPPPSSTYTPPSSSPSGCSSTFTFTSTTVITTTYTSTPGQTSSTPAPTSSTPVPTSSAPASGGTQQRYGQCGGTGYTGPTQCVAGTTCKYSNQWYSQCL